ncbi:GyrI-like domain-containing protein [bacterium]|nr:GyrI-like domain-containing protein [bacterium]MBU1883243.1 GyrI-like domain-containing protein [bacterium]
MKKDTIQKHTKIANDIIYYIYKYIDTDINLDELSENLHVSKYHLHRVFKNEFGKNVYESIKSIRLQKAASLLLTNKNSTITQIAKMCGYSSQTAFSKVFKDKFFMTPKEWRNGGYNTYVETILTKSQSASSSTADFSSLKPTILKMPQMNCYYIRHKGYDRSIKETWQKLQTWTLCNNITEFTQIGLHHDNPTIIPLDECQYIACVVLKKELKNTSLPTLTIPKGVYAKFDFSGKYGDVLKFMHWVYFNWLVSSGYETTTNPSYAIYHKNHFLSDDEEFSLSYYIPIGV